MADGMDVVEIELAGWLQPVLRVIGSTAGPRYFMLHEVRKDGTVVGTTACRCTYCVGTTPALSEAPIG